MSAADNMLGSLEASGLVIARMARARLWPPLGEKILLLQAVPAFLALCDRTLTNERIAELSPEEAGELGRVLKEAHQSIDRIVSAWESNLFLRSFRRRWLREVRGRCNRLEDVVEALAWGSDADLRNHLNHEIKLLNITQTRPDSEIPVH